MDEGSRREGANMIEFIIQRRRDGHTFDISQLVSNIEWTTDIINAQPGTLKFDYIEDDQIIPDYGDIIRFRFDNVGVFFGRLFIKKRNKNGRMQITAYDQLRYLQNKNTYVFPTMTSSQIFTRICGDIGLRFRVVDASPFNVAGRVHDNTSYFDMIDYGLAQTIINTTQWYIIRDNFGTVEHVHLNRLQTGLVIGDQSMATDFEFEGSIDRDTYNRVRMVRDNEETQRRDVFIVHDSTNIALWGPLQFHERVDDNLNHAQIQERAERILRARNRPRRTLKIKSLGDTRIQAGNGIILSIARLRNEGLSAQEMALVGRCKHIWNGGTHTMELSIRVV